MSFGFKYSFLHLDLSEILGFHAINTTFSKFVHKTWRGGQKHSLSALPQHITFESWGHICPLPPAPGSHAPAIKAQYCVPQYIQPFILEPDYCVLSKYKTPVPSTISSYDKALWHLSNRCVLGTFIIQDTRRQVNVM